MISLFTACDTQVDWLIIETEVQEICMVDMVSEFEGITALEGDPEGLVRRVLGGDDLGITLSDKFSAEMYLRGVGVYSATGVEDFDFINTLRVEVASGSEPPVELLNYDASNIAAGDDWFVQSESAVDIAAYIEADDIELRVEFVGIMPEAAWSANLEVCVTAQAAYRETI
ncbi:MAG: hypothetical protein GY811_15010 [Myxococcales bacterium]|nr:hypothetical protein [Myxococcales bacterium]